MLWIVLFLVWLFCPWWIFWPIAIIIFIIWVLYKIASQSKNKQSAYNSSSNYSNYSNYSNNSNNSNKGSNLDQCYKVLGCNANDSMEEIKKAYRKLVKDYHPDKYGSKDLPESVMKDIKSKFMEIQEAYEKIEASRK